MNRRRILTYTITLVIVIVTVIYFTPLSIGQSVTPLFSAKEALSDLDHPYHQWVYMLQGRVTKNSHMSASIWSLRTKARTALIVSAIHTLGEGYLGPGGSLIEERLTDPAEQLGATRIYIFNEKDGSVDSLASVLFILYNPEVPSGQSGNYLRDILPRHDFFVGVIDSQKVVMEPFPNTPAPLKPESPVIFDPSNLTTVAPTYADVIPDDAVILMGYPQTGEYAGMLAASIGRVLSDTEARDTITRLSELGDEEGEIVYDPEAEMIIEGHAVLGMSGGGVFDRSGKQVGILVRASDEYDGKQYVRAVRMIFVVDNLMSAYEALSDSEKVVIGSYLESASTPTPTPTPTPMPTPNDGKGSLSTFMIISVAFGVIVVGSLVYYISRR